MSALLKWIDIATIIIVIVLFPPAALAFVSQNAIPGDAIYPVKRKLEDGILLLASVNPRTKALFDVNLSNRRFDESKALLAEGKSADQTLGELVTQTTIAATQINEMKDQKDKVELQQSLQTSVNKYIATLAVADPGLKGVIATPSPSTTHAPVEQSPSPSTAIPPTQPPSVLTPSTQPVITPSPSAPPSTVPPNDVKKICGNLPSDTGSLTDTIKQLCGILSDQTELTPSDVTAPLRVTPRPVPTPARNNSSHR